MRVLVGEDVPELAGLLRDGLRKHRIDPTLAAGFAEGRDQALAGDYDVVILDVRLPGGTGYDLCADLRRQNVGVPVLMLTALDAVDDRVRGLAARADDYLTQPIALRALVARLQGLTRPHALGRGDVRSDSAAPRCRAVSRDWDASLPAHGCLPGRGDRGDRARDSRPGSRARCRRRCRRGGGAADPRPRLVPLRRERPSDP